MNKKFLLLGLLFLSNSIHADTKFAQDMTFGQGGASFLSKVWTPPGETVTAADIKRGFIYYFDRGRKFSQSASRRYESESHLYRFNSKGELDKTFGNNGFLTFTAQSFNQNPKDTHDQSFSAESIKVQADGKVLLAGAIWRHAFLFRVDLSGKIDSSFGNSGQVFSAGDDWHPNSFSNILIHSNSDISVVEDHWTYVRATESERDLPRRVRRFNSNGKPDLKFANQGILNMDFQGYTECNRAFLSNKDEVIFSARNRAMSDKEKFVLIRIKTDGKYDPTWNRGQPLIYSYSNMDQVECAEASFEPSGKMNMYHNTYIYKRSSYDKDHTHYGYILSLKTDGTFSNPSGPDPLMGSTRVIHDIIVSKSIIDGNGGFWGLGWYQDQPVLLKVNHSRGFDTSFNTSGFQVLPLDTTHSLWTGLDFLGGNNVLFSYSFLSFTEQSSKFFATKWGLYNF
jgi:uncharacterized delta-60 repeat protein